MKKLLFICLFFLLFSFFSVEKTDALYDPLTHKNNIFGVHILFPEELERAAQMVNSNGGDWGYVTIPIQINDRDLEKWQKFMDKAGELHLIPIIRLATQPDPFNTHVWRIPNEYDIVDFANFLDSLRWPIENRYVTVFNEVNRFDEWGGQPPNPALYADILNFAIDVFKARNQNFFMITAGLDNAAPNDRVKHMDNFVFLREMYQHNAEVFKKVDGISSHSYPNPGFAAAPNGKAVMGVATYKHELQVVGQVTDQQKPVFITETGWDAEKVGDERTGSYYRETFETIWKPDTSNIAAVTPFLLESQGGPFDKFSFFRSGKPTAYYDSVAGLAKEKGEPVISEELQIAARGGQQQDLAALPENAEESVTTEQEAIPPFLKIYFKTLLGL